MDNPNLVSLSPKKYSPQEIFDLYHTPLPTGRFWTHRSLASELGISLGALQRALRAVNTPIPSQSWPRQFLSHHEIRLAFPSDIHIPEHDPRALELAYKLIADFAPHVLVVGSDMFDFPNISRYPTSPQIQQEDALSKPLEIYRGVMAALRHAAPQAVFPFLVGNHDERLFDWIDNQAPQLRDYVLQNFLSDIQSGGALWIKRDYREFRLAHLNVLHGYKAVQHTAYAYVNDYAEDVIAGHTHRPDSYFKQFRHRSAQAHIAGCLCRLKPHYAKYWQKWQQGLLLVTLTPTKNLTQVDNIVFNQYSVIWRGKEYKV